MSDSLCPYCPYVDESGKTHDPLSTQVERTIHEQTHKAEQLDLLERNATLNELLDFSVQLHKRNGVDFWKIEGER